MIADQLDNVMKSVNRGFGLAVSPKGGLRADSIGAALRAVLSDPGFKEAAVKLSKRLRSRTRTPAQEAAGRSPNSALLMRSAAQLSFWMPAGVNSCAWPHALDCKL